MIRITSQSDTHQYDENGRAITEWHEKKYAWIILPEFENEVINWWGEDDDFFPRAYKLKDFIQRNPSWDKLPDISVRWYWNDKETCTASRSWGYLDYSKQEALEQLGKYCSFHKFAQRTVVFYNGEVLFDGKLL